MPIDEECQKCKVHNKYLTSVINDLTLSLEMWIDGYSFDEDHICKQRQLIDNSCRLIGKPRSMEELVIMSGLGDEYLELARQSDKEALECRLDRESATGL